VSILQAAADAFGGQVHEQKVRERVDDFRRILRNNIVLTPSVQDPTISFRYKQTSSHQSSVEVTGENHPSCSGGYGIDGKRENSAAILPNQYVETRRSEVDRDLTAESSLTQDIIKFGSVGLCGRRDCAATVSKKEHVKRPCFNNRASTRSSPLPKRM
jgi:hypothetical protein